jgi:hypothetical protein
VEKRFIVKIVETQYECPKCHQGTMKATGVIKFKDGGIGNPDGINYKKDMLFQHICTAPNCYHEEYFDKSYPCREEIFEPYLYCPPGSACGIGQTGNSNHSESVAGVDGKRITIQYDKDGIPITHGGLAEFND